jgi:hypothetical protein
LHANLIKDFIQSIGGLLAIRWVALDKVVPGPLCTLQGVLLTSGDIGSAIWTFIITIHTFILLAGGRRLRYWITEKTSAGVGRWILGAAVWTFVLISGLFGLLFIEPFQGVKRQYCTWSFERSDKR